MSSRRRRLALIATLSVLTMATRARAQDQPPRVTAIVLFSDAQAGVYAQSGDRTLRVMGPGSFAVGARIDGRVTRGADGTPQLEDVHALPAPPAALPAPRRVQPSQLSDPADQTGWIEVEATVHDSAERGEVDELAIGAGGVRVPVIVSGHAASALPLVDATVRLHAVRQFIRGAAPGQSVVRLLVPSIASSDIVAAARPDPFTAPRTDATAVRNGTAAAQSDHRAVVQGTVLLVHGAFLRGRTVLHVQDATGVVPIEVPGDPGIVAGNTVVAAGFPEIANGLPLLANGVVRRTGTGPAPQPIRATAAELLTEKYPGGFVTVRATVESQTATDGAALLTLTDGSTRLVAYFYGWPTPELPAVAPGTVVDVDGVSVVVRDPSNQPMLLLSTGGPSHLVVVSRPSWWTRQHLQYLLIGAAAAALLALAWVVVLDVRVRQRTRQLQSARDAAEEASRAKSTFLAHMSHEVRTPMNGIIGLADLMLAGELPDAQREHLTTLKGSAESLLGLLNDMLDFSTIESGHLRLEAVPFDLADVVQHAAQLLEARAAQKGLTLQTTVNVNPTPVLGDPLRVRQVLLNLLANALKFTDAGGITVDVSQDANGTTRIAVADTGIGISPDKHALIFEPFAQADATMTRKYGGSGLGLTITNALVRAMGGQVTVQSHPGDGSTFIVTLPLPPAPTRPTAADVPAPVEGRTGPPRRVLVVEDNPVNRTVAVGLLKKRGHDVTVAENGQAALALFEPGRFDVILMDVQMPEMDGFEATARIRRDESAGGPRVPIIAMTAHAMTGDRERCLAAGMDDYVSKPVSAAALFAAVESARQ